LVFLYITLGMERKAREKKENNTHTFFPFSPKE